MNFITSVHALATATSTTTASSKSTSSSPTFLIVLVVVFGALYFLVLRPSQRKRLANVQQSKAYSVGDEVIAGGMIGRVVRVGVGEVDVDAGDGIFTFVAQAVQSRAAFNAGPGRRSPVPASTPALGQGPQDDDDADSDDDVEGDEYDDDADDEGDADDDGDADGGDADGHEGAGHDEPAGGQA